MTIYTTVTDENGKDKFRPIMEPSTIMHVAVVTLPEPDISWRETAQHYTKEYFWSNREEAILASCRQLLQRAEPQAPVTKRVARYVTYSSS